MDADGKTDILDPRSLFNKSPYIKALPIGSSTLNKDKYSGKKKL